MRILLLSHYALPHVGGIEIVMDELARSFEERGHEVTILASNAGGSGSGPTSGRIVRIPALNVAEDRLGVPWPLFSPAVLPALRKEVARADVVHAHGLLYLSSAFGLLFAKRAAHRPVRIVTEHVGHVPYASRSLDRIESAALNTLGKMTARAAQALIVLNDDVARFVAGLAPEVPISRIDNGLDLQAYRPAEPGERVELRQSLGWDDRPVVLFVGRRVAKKGIESVLSAAEAAPELRFVLVGPGDKPSGLPQNVHCPGTVGRDELRTLYRSVDAFLLPSYGEGFSLAAQEAMASGVPIVLREGEGHHELALEAAPGVVEAPPDGAALALALRTLLRDPDVHASARAAVRRVAEHRFSGSAWADAHLALYECVKSGRPESAALVA